MEQKKDCNCMRNGFYAVIAFTAIVGGRDFARVPADYMAFNPAQIEQQDRRFVQMEGVPESINLKTYPVSRLNIILENSPVFMAEAGPFGDFTQGRLYNAPSREKQQVAYEALVDYVNREGDKEPIILKGQLEGKVLNMYAVVVDGVEFSLMRDDGWISRIQDALKS